MDQGNISAKDKVCEIDARRQPWIRLPDTDLLKIKQVRFGHLGPDCMAIRQGDYLNDKWFWIFNPQFQPALSSYVRANRANVEILVDESWDIPGQSVWQVASYVCVVPSNGIRWRKTLFDMAQVWIPTTMDVRVLGALDRGIRVMGGRPSQSLSKNYSECTQALNISYKFDEFIDIFISDDAALLQARLANTGFGVMEPFVDIGSIFRLLKVLNAGVRTWERDQNL